MHKVKIHSCLILSFLANACGQSKPEDKVNISLTKGFYAPTLGMTLGRGFDPTRPLEPRGDCIANVSDSTSTSWLDANGMKGSFSETQIKSIADLHRELSISGSVAGESLWGSANTSYSKFEKFVSNENTFTWLMNFSVLVGERTLNGNKLKLSQKAQQLVDAGRLDDFYRMCGTEYIRSIKLGGKLTIVHEIESKHKELVERIKQSIQGGASFGSWGFSGSARYESYFNEASFRSVLKREIEQIGGTSVDVNRLTPDRLGEYLVEYEKDMRASNAAVIGVETASWDTLGVAGLNSFADWHRKETISQLYKQYRLNQDNLSKISDYAYWKQEGYYQISDNDLYLLNQAKEQLSTQNKAIEAHANACIQADICDSSNLPLLTVNFPSLVDALQSETFGNLEISIPMLWAYWGSSDSILEGRDVRVYALPSSLLNEPRLSRIELSVFSMDCKGAEPLLREAAAKLERRGVVIDGLHSLDDGKTYQLSWREHYPVRLYAKVLENGTCGMMQWSYIAEPGLRLKPSTEQVLRTMAQSMRSTYK